MPHLALFSKPTDGMPSQVSLGDLIEIMIDIGRGGAYLEQHKHVHRDLAARNCLISSRSSHHSRITKIGKDAEMIRRTKAFSGLWPGERYIFAKLLSSERPGFSSASLAGARILPGWPIQLQIRCLELRHSFMGSDVTWSTSICGEA